LSQKLVRFRKGKRVENKMTALLFGRRGNKRKESCNFFVLLLDWEKGKRKERSIYLLNYKNTFQKLKYNKKIVQIRERT